MAPESPSPLDQKILEHFPGLVVRKDLTTELIACSWASCGSRQCWRNQRTTRSPGPIERSFGHRQVDVHLRSSPCPGAPSAPHSSSAAPRGMSWICLRPSLISNSSPGFRPSWAV